MKSITRPDAVDANTPNTKDNTGSNTSNFINLQGCTIRNE